MLDGCVIWLLGGHSGAACSMAGWLAARWPLGLDGCVLSGTSHMPQPASSPMHAHTLHLHSHQPSPHHPASAVPLTVGKGGGAERVARTRSAAHAIEQCVRSAWRGSVMRAQQHQPCGALSWRRRRARTAAAKAAAGERLPQAAAAVATRARGLTRFHDPYRMWWPSTRRSGWACTVQCESTRPAATPASDTSSYAREQPHARFVDA